MNLSETIKQMGQPLEEKKPPFTPDTPDYAGAAKKIRDYAKKSGGIDKNDMLSIANQLDALAKKSSPKLLARTMANIGSLDTDVRDKIKELMKESNCMEALELDEAMVRGKEVFDKTFANKTQADNFAKKNGGRVKQVGRVFYVFKEANDEDEAPASPDEGSMAKTQLEFIEYAAEEIAEHIEAGKRFPEWMQNKLSQAHEKMKGLHAALGDHGEEELDEDFYNVVYRDKKGKVQGEKEFDTKSAAEKYAKLGNSRDKVGGKYTVTLVRDGGMGRRNEEVELDEGAVSASTVEKEIRNNGGKDIKKGDKEITFTMGNSKKTVTVDRGFVKDRDYMKLQKMFEEVELDELKKYDKNADFRVLNRLSQKQKTGNLTPAEKQQMANAKARLRNHGFSEEVELEENYSWNDVNDALTKANYMRGKPAEIMKVANKFDYKSGNDKKFSLADVKKNLSAAGIDGARQHNVMKHMKEEVEINEAFESAFEEELAEAKYQVDIKGAGRETVMAKNERDAIAKAAKKMKVHSYKTPDVTVKLMEEVEEKLSLEDTLQAIWEGKKLDPVNKKAVKKDFDDRKDKDIDNDGDVDDSDEYLHKRRQATSKSIEKDSDKAEKNQDKEISDKEDEDKKEKVGKSGKQTKVDVNPSIEEEKGEEMTSAEMEKRDEIMKSLEKKKDDFVKKYGDRAKEVMARTAIKMAKKHA